MNAELRADLIAGLYAAHLDWVDQNETTDVAADWDAMSDTELHECYVAEFGEYE